MSVPVRSFTGLVHSGTNSSWANWIRPPCSWAGLSSILSTSTGQPGGLYASTNSVGHPGLPESRHYCWIPGNYTHNSSPRSSSRSAAMIPIPPSSSTISEPARISRNFKKLNLRYHLGRRMLQLSCGQKCFPSTANCEFHAHFFSRSY